MKRLILLMALSAGAAHAQDEYYTLSAVMTQNLVGAPGNLPLTVTGWIETSGFGVGCEMGPGGVGPCLPYVNGHWTQNPIIIADQINLTYDGITETASFANSEGGLVGYVGMVATPKGLFCNKCEAFNGGIPWFDIASNPTAGAGGVTYQYYDTGGGTTPGPLQFQSPHLKNNFRIGNYPTSTMPTTAGCVNVGPCILSGTSAIEASPRKGAAAPELNASGTGAALTLLIGMGLVLQGRRHG